MPIDKYLTFKDEKEEQEQHQGNKSLGMSCGLNVLFMLRQELQMQCVKMQVLQENRIKQKTSGKSQNVCTLYGLYKIKCSGFFLEILILVLLLLLLLQLFFARFILHTPDFQIPCLNWSYLSETG